MYNKSYQTYKQQAVLTMSQGDMLTTVYDGLIKELLKAQSACQTGDFVTINSSLQKAQRIIKHLEATLNLEYEVSGNLLALYDYFNYVIIQANVKKDGKMLDGIIKMIGDLRNTFVQADKAVKSGEATL